MVLLSKPDGWRSLSLSQQVAQMIVVRASGHLFDCQIEYPVWEPPTDILRHYIEELGVGGVILLGGTAAEVRLRSPQLQAWAKLPLLIGADIEEGVGQRFAGATRFPPPMTLNAIAQTNLPQAIAYAEQMGEITAKEAAAIGLNWLYAPIVDVNNNPANPVINVRAWGETPEIVSQLTTAFIRGAQHHQVLTCAKHFPGHGDTAVDSHLDLPVIAHDRDRLESVEFVPFKAAIAAQVDSVMTAHLRIPTLDPDLPATLSRSILTGELRDRLQFSGLIVTDAMVMGAIANRYGANEAVVMAVAAGADVVVMPGEPEQAIAAITAAVESGRIAQSQIEASLQRIWAVKQKLFDPSQDLIPTTTETVMTSLMESVATKEAIATSDAIVRDAMRVYCPPDFQWQPKQAGRNLIVLDDAVNCAFLGRHTPAIAIPQMLGYKLQIVDSYSPVQQLDPDQINIDRVDQAMHPTLLQLFIRSNPFRDSAGTIQLAKRWLQFLLQTNQLQAVVLYGTPYAVDQFVANLPASIPYVFTYGQMESAQAIALQALMGTTTLVGKEDKTTTD